MASLLQSPPRSRRTADEVRADLRHRRPLVAVALLGGAGAALGPLVVCLAAGVVGWFLSDAGAHGTPTDALRVGALGWLMAHGSGLVVSGAPVTAVPLGLTVACAWAIWRIGLRVGDSVSGHGPDLDALADGERDLTVPVTAGLFTLTYAVVAGVVTALAGSATTRPSTAGVVAWSVALGVLVGGTSIAVGSGRAAGWVALLPPVVRAAAATVRQMLLLWLAVSAVVLVVSLIVDFSTAVNVMSQLHLGAGSATLYTLLSLLVLPNAAVFSSAYLLGPGFTVGVGTVVSPTAVSIGPLPMFPLLAALPDTGPHPVWTPALIALAPLVAVVAVVRVQRRRPTLRWDHGALRGGCAGVVTGVVVGVVSGLAGGAVGPGRMADVGPYAGQVLVHAIAWFGVAGVLAGLATTWWQRRTLTPAEVAGGDPAAEPAAEQTRVVARPAATSGDVEETRKVERTRPVERTNVRPKGDETAETELMAAVGDDADDDADDADDAGDADRSQ